MILIRIFMIGDHLFANIAYVVHIPIGMQALIGAFAAHAVGPRMGFARHGHNAAAAPLLLVSSGRPCPFLLSVRSVSRRIGVAVGFPAAVAELGGIAIRRAAVVTLGPLHPCKHRQLRRVAYIVAQGLAALGIPRVRIGGTSIDQRRQHRAVGKVPGGLFLNAALFVGSVSDSVK